MLRRAPDEVDVPGLGLLQWWSEAPFDREHWYVSEDQQAYRVTIDDWGPSTVADINGKPIRRIIAADPVRIEEPALL